MDPNRRGIVAMSLAMTGFVSNDALVKHAPSGAPAWPREDYLNLWVCPLDDGLLGYASFLAGRQPRTGS